MSGVSKVVQRGGERVNKGGRPKGTGNRNSWKTEMRGLVKLNDVKTAIKVLRKAMDGGGANANTAAKYILDQMYGKATNSTIVKGDKANPLDALRVNIIYKNDDKEKD